ncbi:alpha/beta fold hydrolase BchO [Sandarakinorhabdus sp. DWP1-3-1]|uniref:alpha/beta fold hydrolase BchO n=1 Tax=Sandarakinorhabdus sp. DWP1-3-1 TaxID=2804627 RepID=UPI003CEB4FCB
MSAPKWSIEGKDWPNAEASRFVPAGGVRWHVQVMGQGPVLLLIHGTAAATHSWRDLMPLLATQFTVVAPDLPGHGFTSAMARPTPTSVATALAALLDVLQLEPALTVGHSAGAAIALTMAEKRLARPQAIVSLGGALLPFPGMAGKLFPALARMIFVNPLMPELFAMRARVPGEVPSFLHRATGSRIDPRGLQLYERLLRTSGHIGGALALMANWDLEPLERALSGLDLPILLVHGDHDKTIPAKTAHRVAARLPQAEVKLLPGAGHLSHEEDPAGHAALIVDFARRVAVA